jgi:uncharacterized protein
MTETKTYIFSRPGCGRLELEVDPPAKKIYGDPQNESISFFVQGLDRDTLNKSERFYFFEWQKIRYSYALKNEGGFQIPLKLVVNDRTERISGELADGIHVLAGDISFKDQVGETTIRILDNNNKQVFTLATEVFPQKMDYKSDYKAMMSDISSIVENLVFDRLKDTFRKSRARLAGHATYTEWWNILDTLFEQLIISLSVIKRQPKHEIRVKENVTQVGKVRQLSKRNLDWLRKNPQFSNQDNIGLKYCDTHYATHALSCKKYVTYDTYENRFVVWAIKSTIERLRKYKRCLERVCDPVTYETLLGRMEDYQSRLQSILHDTPFSEVGTFEKRAHFSTSLTRGAGYRDFMHIYILLSRGLEIVNNDIFKIEQKNVSTLYEYWCFLKLVQILKEQNNSEIDLTDLIRVNANKIQVELYKGIESKVAYRKSETNEVTTIYFNREFGVEKSFTYAQRPDFALEFNKRDYDRPFWYLFDAKYRFDEDAINENNQYNVPQDAIGQLHRYRDAILHSQSTNTSYRRAVKNLGGIILYPYPLTEENFRSNTYYGSIEQVNIGSMPFLPSKTSLVTDFLNELINKSPDSHFDDYIEMDRSEYEKHRNRWRDRVTIGVIPFENQDARIQFLKEKMIFHVPFVVDNNSALYSSKSILACVSGTQNGFLFDVDHWEIMTTSELQKMGTLWSPRHPKYVVFHFKNYEEIQTPEKLSPRRYRYSTLEGLSRYLKSDQRDQNLFYLTNPDAARLYNEIKKTGRNIEVKWVKNSVDPSLVEFTIGNDKIRSSDKFDFLAFKLNGVDMFLNDVLAHIRAQIDTTDTHP